MPESKSKDKINPMRALRIDKVVVNIGVGEGGERLRKAERVLELLTGQKPYRTVGKKTNRDLGVRKGGPIGCKVTLRGPRAEEFVRKALWVKENKVSLYSFDDLGNLSFGIRDYTQMKDMKYDPDIGIFGMDITVVLKRPGKRVALRKRRRSKIGHKHRVSIGEAIGFFKERFNVEVVE